MNDGKGKGRASNIEDSGLPPSDNQSSSTSRSLFDRVAASASGLAHDAFAAPTSNEISDATSVALTSTGKSRELGGREGFSGESSGSNQQTSRSGSQGGLRSSIRSHHGEEHIRDTDTEFSSFLDGVDPFSPSSEPDNHAEYYLGQAVTTLDEHANGRRDSPFDQGRQVSYSTVDEQQQHDGDAVLNILSHSSTNIDEFQPLSAEEEAVHWDLTEEQILRLQKVVDEIFPPPDQHITISAEHPLNLVPDMVSINTSSTAAPAVSMPLEEGHMFFGQNLPPNTARQVWMDQWENVLTRYTDEVWGDLLPLVVEAREDIKTMKDESPGGVVNGSKALRRLRMVLDHVRKL